MTTPKKKDKGINNVMKSGNLNNTTLTIIFGSIKPSAACSKYPTNLELTTKKRGLIKLQWWICRLLYSNFLKEYLFYTCLEKNDALQYLSYQ